MTTIEPPPAPIRACYHCRFAQIDDDADMVCMSIDVNVRITRDPMICREARDTSQPCGPEARFWQLEKAPT